MSYAFLTCSPLDGNPLQHIRRPGAPNTGHAPGVTVHARKGTQPLQQLMQINPTCPGQAEKRSTLTPVHCG